MTNPLEEDSITEGDKAAVKGGEESGRGRSWGR